MPSLLSQPDPIIENIQSYLGPRSVTRLESTHPELQKTVSKSNRYWKDSFVREAEKGNHVHQGHDALSPNLLALKSAHPNSEPKGYWKGRYRDEIHQVRKEKHDQKVDRELSQYVNSYVEVGAGIAELALVPSALTVFSGGIVFYCSVQALSGAAAIQIMSAGLASPITLPMMGLSVCGLAGGLTTVAVGLSSACATAIPMAIGLGGVAQLSEWKFNRERAQEEESFVEES